MNGMKPSQNLVININTKTGSEMKDLSKEAQEIIYDLLVEGFDNSQIKDAMCDGEYLKKEGINQEISEEIHSYLNN